MGSDVREVFVGQAVGREVIDGKIRRDNCVDFGREMWGGHRNFAIDTPEYVEIVAKSIKCHDMKADVLRYTTLRRKGCFVLPCGVLPQARHRAFGLCCLRSSGKPSHYFFCVAYDVTAYLAEWTNSSIL